MNSPDRLAITAHILGQLIWDRSLSKVNHRLLLSHPNGEEAMLKGENIALHSPYEACRGCRKTALNQRTNFK